MQHKQGSKKILVVAAHPDDDTIGCGGSIAKHVSRGNEVFIVYVTTGAVENPEVEVEKLTRIRKREIKEAIKILSVKQSNLIFLNYKPSNVNQRVLFQQLLNLTRQIQPNLCYIPHTEERDDDHKLVGRVAIDAISRAPGRWFRTFQARTKAFEKPTILTYEISDTLASFQYIEDITKFIEQKMEALACYQSQRYADYQHRTKGLNAFRGGNKGKYAEVFQVISLSHFL